MVIQDVRGRFASEGENLPFDRDGPDGFDTAEWVARQPWCNGKIGTWGGSAGAITQLQLAGSGTDKVACQHLVVGAPSLYHDAIYSGGVFRKALSEDWLRTSKFGSNALPRWVSHPLFDDYWRERDVGLRYEAVAAPAVHIGGYWDIFAQGTIDAFLGYQGRGRGQARGNQKLVMGPWTHSVLQSKAGELEFPGGKKPPNRVEDAWAWFDHWLKGKDNGAERWPAVTYYVLGDVSDAAAPGNTWRTADTWPPVPTVATRYYLHGNAAFSTNAPVSHEPLSYSYDPTNPAPTIGGIQLTLPAGPMDQRKLDGRKDVLAFTSVALTEPIEVTGRLQAVLWIASDAPDTDFFVMLCDVYPDGRVFNISEGRLRARFREGFDRETMLEPGKVYKLSIDLWSTSIIFNRGHRLRVYVTSSSAPGFDPNPNTGEPFRSGTATRVARNAVYADPEHASHLVLPVAGGR